MEQVRDFTIFAKAVELKSISGVARVLNIPKASVSRALSRLEEEFGARLFERTSRLLQMTEVGVAFHQHCLRILDEVDQARVEIDLFKTDPTGPLRLGCTGDISRDILAPCITEFLERYPSIDVRVRVGERQVPEANLIDVVLHAGWLLDSRFIVRKLCDVDMILVASRKYLEREGLPQSLDDLDGHRIIGNIYLDRMAPDPGRLPAYVPWLELLDEPDPRRVPIWPRFASTDLSLALTIVRDGVAIASTIRPRVARELETGEIVQILPHHPITRQPALYALTLELAATNAKVDLFIKFLLERSPYQRLVERSLP